MKKKAVPELGPLEFKLLRILWKHDSLTAPQALEEYNRGADTPLAYTTVMTLLGRMAEKNVLAVNREHQPYRFAAAISREQMLRQRVRDFINVFFEGQPLDLVMRLVENTPMSEESVQKLEAVLRERKSKSKSKRGL
jgi:predicted transcriptional regulator